MNRTRGFTLIELLVVIAIIALLIGLLLPALAKAQKNARSLRDKAQIKQIHQAMLVFANDNDSVLPTPGLINRDMDPYTGTQVSGVGPENINENHTANIYSAMIAAEFFNTDLLIGPTEVNPEIQEYLNYDYTAYNPSEDSYWDRNFKCRLNTQAGECNSSYYHMVLLGQRKKGKWRNSANDNDPMIATRGTRDGVYEGGGQNGEYYYKSQTLLLHGGKKEWQGNIAYSDNHTEVSVTFFPGLVAYEPRLAPPQGRLQKDNIFAAEFNDFPNPQQPNPYLSGDAWLNMYAAINANNQILILHEPLLD